MKITKSQHALQSAKVRNKRITQKTAHALDGLAVHFFVVCGGAADIFGKLGMSRAGNATLANAIIVPSLDAAPGVHFSRWFGWRGHRFPSVFLRARARKGDAWLSPGSPP